MNAGLSGEALLCVVRSIEADLKPTSAEMLVARKREADRVRMADRRATVALQSRDADEPVVPSSPPSSLSPTPPITTPPAPSSDTQNAREAENKAVSRGTRLPKDFVPLPSILEMGRNRGLTEFQLIDELEKFRDWANAATGQVSIKRDWQGAFRNWIKRAADERKKPGENHKRSPKPGSIAAGFAIIDDALSREEAAIREEEERQRDGEADADELPGLRQVN